MTRPTKSAMVAAQDDNGGEIETEPSSEQREPLFTAQNMFDPSGDTLRSDNPVDQRLDVRV